MKRIISVLLVSLCFFNLTSCSGYNRRMREHLGDKDNYFTVSAEFINYNDKDSLMYITIKNSDSIKDSDVFDGSELDYDKINLKLIGENYNTLKDVFINNEIKPGTSITVKCSTWIYQDTRFYYIAELKTQEKTYLEFEDGMENIIDYMSHNKSLL